MSRPSITASPSPPSSRWRSRITSRTAVVPRDRRGRRGRSRGSRIAAVTSLPSMKTRPASSKLDRMLGARARRARRRRRARPRARARARSARGTSRRCRGSGSRAARRAPGDRALAGPGGPVDGDDHARSGLSAARASRSRSKKPGKLTATRLRALELDALAGDEPGDRAEHRDPVVAAASTCPPPRGRGGTPRTAKPSSRRARCGRRGARSASATASMRSVSFDAQLLRRRATTLSPRACPAASAKSGSSSTSSGTSSAPTVGRRRARRRGPRGRRPARRRSAAG